jgi:hypothetical protein
MLRSLLPILLILTHLACSHAHHQIAPPPSPPSTPAALSQHPVIGNLGLPLGTPTEIEATIIAGRDLRMKEYENRYLLRITTVAGRTLPEPQVMDFSVRGSAHLAADASALHELKTGQESRAIDSDQIPKLEQDYVGKRVRLLAYETGRYSGIPRNLPKDFPVWQDHSFAFTTSLVVLEERK